MSTSNVLDPSVILHSTSQVITELKSPYDALAAASHAIMLGVGFRFAGLGDDARQGECLHVCCLFLFINRNNIQRETEV